MLPINFHLLRKCQKYCESSELNVKMPQRFRPPRSVEQRFSGRILTFSKKKVIALTEASFSGILWYSWKKKRSSVWDALVFYRLCGAEDLSCSCLRFFGGFWQELTMPNFAKIQCKNASKILHFFALIGNTVSNLVQMFSPKYLLNKLYSRDLE